MSEVATTQSAAEILKLARNDRRAATLALGNLNSDRAVALVCETPVNRRGELLGLFPDLANVVPSLPEAELCYTAKAVGLHDSGWILVHASPEQLQACVDLDAWRDHAPDSAAFGAWMSALLEAGEETALGIAVEIDAEVLCLWLRSQIDVMLKPDDDDGFEPPENSQTLDGQFYYIAKAEKDDLQEVGSFLRMLFQKEYWHYFRLMQSVIWELDPENQEWALRWRNGRLQDMGFPDAEESLQIYAPLPDAWLNGLPADPEPLIGEWSLPIWMPGLPAPDRDGPSLLYVLAELPEDRQREALYRLISIANRVAIADRLPLGDSESLPDAIGKAISVASTGLDHLSRLHADSPGEIAGRVGLLHLFRLGASLDRSVVPEVAEDALENSAAD